MHRPLAIILSTVALDAIGIGIIAPILPSLLRDVFGSGEISFVYASLIALYALMQFLFAPILGMLSDRFGRRPVLILSLCGASLDYLLMANAPSLWFLVVGRAIAGITAANIAVVTAYITDISPEEQRARRFGYFHAVWGIGFIIGPLLGGLLGEFSLRAPFFAAALLNGVNCCMALFLLPESRGRSPADQSRRIELNPFAPLKWAFGFHGLLPLLLLTVTMMFVGQMYGTAWVLFSEERFGWDAMTIGASLAGLGFFRAVVQAFVTGPVVAKYGERSSLIAGLSIEVLCLIALGLATHGWIAFALLPLFAAGGIGMPALQSLITYQVDSDRQGQLQGVLASLLSVTSVVGPLFFGAVFALTREAWPGAVWIVGAIIYCASLPLMLGINSRSWVMDNNSPVEAKGQA